MLTNDTVRHLLALIFPLVVGFLARWIMQGVKAAIGAVDNFPAWGKQITVILISALLSFLGTWLGVDFGTTLNGLTEGSITTLLAAIFAMVTHNGTKLQNISRYGTTDPTPSQRASKRAARFGIMFLFAVAGLTACTTRSERHDSVSVVVTHDSTRRDSTVPAPVPAPRP